MIQKSEWAFKWDLLNLMIMKGSLFMDRNKSLVHGASVKVVAISIS